MRLQRWTVSSYILSCAPKWCARGTPMSDSQLHRRDVLLGAAALAVTAAHASGAKAAPNATAATPPPVPALQGNHRVEPLAFDPTKLNGLSERMMRSHHENNYA